MLNELRKLGGTLMQNAKEILLGVSQESEESSQPALSSSSMQSNEQSGEIYWHPTYIMKDVLVDLYPLDHIYGFETARLPARVRAKVENFQKILKRNVIDMQALRELSYLGIPEDCPGLRSIVWRLLVGLLPCEKAQWAQCMRDNVTHYEQLVDKYVYNVVTPEDSAWEQQQKLESENFLNRNVTAPIVLEYEEFFKDHELWGDIEKDTTRTRSEMHFFVTNTQNNSKPFRNPFKQNAKVEEKHFDVLSRILFVYAKTNPHVKYIQGMNEILALFYHVYLHDRGFQKTIEADSYFSFTFIMRGAQDCFLKIFDDSDIGINARVKKCNDRLRETDYELWKSLEDLNLNPHFYSFRWILLIFTQEFEIFDVTRLWDSFLAHSEQQSFIECVCIAVLQILRENFVDDFSIAMESLQSISQLDIGQIIVQATELYLEHSTKE